MADDLTAAQRATLERLAADLQNLHPAFRPRHLMDRLATLAISELPALLASLRAAEERASAAEAERDRQPWFQAMRAAQAEAKEDRAQAAAAEMRAARDREALRRLEWSFRQTALRNGGTIYTAELCPACKGERNPPDDKGSRRQRGDPLPPAGHTPDCWLAAHLAAATTKETP